MRSDEKIRILFLASNPTTTSRLELEEELRCLENELRGIVYRNEFTLIAHHAVRPDDLVRLLRSEQPTVVHFSGHGSADGIVLRGVGGHIAVSADALTRLFGDRGIRLVVLNACLSEHQAFAISRVVPAVVGTRTAVSDEAARLFTTTFYGTLGGGWSVRDALRDAEDALVVHGWHDDDIPYSAYGNLESVLCGEDSRPKPPVTTVELVEILGRLAQSEKVVFRAILKSSEHVHKNVFREFFRATNRIGGNPSDGHRSRIIRETGLGFEIVIAVTKQLRNEGLIDEWLASEMFYCPTDSVIAIVNRSREKILQLLYTQMEIDSPPVEVFFGSTRFKDGTPDYYTDMDDVPLEGRFRMRADSDVVTLFRDGRVIGVD